MGYSKDTPVRLSNKTPTLRWNDFIIIYFEKDKYFLNIFQLIFKLLIIKIFDLNRKGGTMKISMLLGSLLLVQGIMVDQPPPQRESWVAIQEKENGLQASFPFQPVKMNIDHSSGHLCLYSTPTSKGLLALTTVSSAELNREILEEKNFLEFFEKTIASHFFFNPSVLRNPQLFRLDTASLKGEEVASFQCLFQDHKGLKKIEGVAFIQKDVLYVAFYMAHENDFDRDVSSRFLESIEF